MRNVLRIAIADLRLSWHFSIGDLSKVLLFVHMSVSVFRHLFIKFCTFSYRFLFLFYPILSTFTLHIFYFGLSNFYVSQSYCCKLQKKPTQQSLLGTQLIILPLVLSFRYSFAWFVYPYFDLACLSSRIFARLVLNKASSTDWDAAQFFIEEL